ncbi:MAG: hypothetical protein AAGL69_02145 [Pseudomonadota bacterium]
MQIRRHLKRLYYDTPIQSLVLKTLSPWRPAPWATSTMEFDYGLWLGPSSLRCETQRQLGEENVWPTLFRRHVATDYNVTKMRGSREGLLINMTALHLVMHAWNDALALMQSLRDGYLTLQPDRPNHLSQADLFILSKAGCGLPAYLVRHLPARYHDGQLPAIVGTQFKLIAGFFMVIQHNLWARDGTRQSFTDAAAFFDYADRHQIFTSPGGRACGGSRRKIMELYDHLQQPGEVPDLKPLESMVDVVRFFEYVVSALHLELTLLVVQRQVKATYLHVDASSDSRSDARRARIEWLRDTDAIESVIKQLERLQLSREVAASPSRELRALASRSVDEVATPEQRPAHYQALIRSVQRYASDRQADILAGLNRPSLKQLSEAQVNRRLELSAFAGQS